MDQEAFFTGLGFKKMDVNGEWWYEGPYHRQYRLKDTSTYIAILIRKDGESKSNDRLRFYRIMKEDDMLPEMKEAMQFFSSLNEGIDPENREFIKGSIIFPRIAKYVRQMIEKDIGPREWDNLCLLYDAAVRAGGEGYLISEACKEVMKLAWMQPNDYVLPEMHELLIKIPDAYFDFVTGIERNLQDREYLQKRLIRFIKTFPEVNTIDIIIFVSFMNENGAMTDEELGRLYRLTGKTAIFSGRTMKELPHELLEARDKQGWRISTFYTHGLLYRIRHANSIIFVDYQDSAIGHILLSAGNGKTAQIHSIHLINEFDHPGVREKLVEYAEQVVKFAGFHYLTLECNKNWYNFYSNLGYDGEYDADSKEERIQMTKELL